MPQIHGTGGGDPKQDAYGRKHTVEIVGMPGRRLGEVSTVRDPEPETNADLKFLDNGKIAVLTVRHWYYFADPERKVTLYDFLQKSFEQIHENGSSNLSIDVRDNDGGRAKDAFEAVVSSMVNGPLKSPRENGNQSSPTRAAQLVCERDVDLPIWVRAPKRGHEFYSGCSRPKLYEWAAKGFIRSVSIREPGRIKGVRLFHLASILAFIERCEASPFTQETRRQTRQSAGPKFAHD